MIKINEIPVGFPAKMANGITIRTMPISTDAVSWSTYYELFSVTTSVDEEGVETETVEKLAEGNCDLSEEQFAAWGQEMSYVEDVVLINLGLQRDVPIEEV